jgi:hypothetical protein
MHTPLLGLRYSHRELINSLSATFDILKKVREPEGGRPKYCSDEMLDLSFSIPFHCTNHELQNLGIELGYCVFDLLRREEEYFDVHSWESDGNLRECLRDLRYIFFVVENCLFNTVLKLLQEIKKDKLSDRNL